MRGPQRCRVDRHAVDRAIIVLLNVALVARSRAGVRQHDGAHAVQLVGADGRGRDLAAIPRSRSHSWAARCLRPRPVHRDHDAWSSARPARWNAFFKAVVEWIVIVISLLIGGYSVPLLLSNAEEKTLLLGISYVWMTLPITLGSRAVRAARGLRAAAAPVARSPSRRRRGRRCAGGRFLLSQAPLGAHAVVLYVALAGAVPRAGRDRRADRLRAGDGRHRLRAGDRLGRHDGRGDERAARLGRLHLPRAAVLHPGRLHHGPRRHRRADRRVRRLADRPRARRAAAGDDRRRLHLVVHLRAPRPPTWRPSASR